MLRRNKAMSIVMAMCLCLAMLAPIFVAPPAADASSDYTVIKTQTVSNVGDYLTSVKIQIDIDNIAALSAGDIVTIHMPADIIMENNAGALLPHKQAGYDRPDVIFDSQADGDDQCVDLTAGAWSAVGIAGTPNVQVTAPQYISGTETNALNYASDVAPAFIAYPVGNSAIEIKITGVGMAAGTAGRLYVNLLNCKVNGTFDGDITAVIAAPSGSGFSAGSVTFATYAGGGGGTSAVAKSVVTMGSAAKALDSIMIQETAKNTLQPGDEITLKLPSGFKWVSDDAITAAWGFATCNMGITTADTDIGTDARKMVITMPAAAPAAAPLLAWSGSGLASEGRLYFYGTIEVDDEDQADLGDVTVHVSGDNVTAQDIVVAKYAEYGVSVTAKIEEEVVAGWDDTELGSFNIAENMSDSLIPGRIINFTLPTGVKWDDTGLVAPLSVGDFMTVKPIKGTNWTTAATVTLNKNKTQLKITLPAAANAKSSIDFKELNVKISPDFVGDLNLEVSGTAGAEGTVKVATVIAPIAITVSDPANIIIGMQDQVIGDILLKEGKAEAVKATAGANDTITLMLPEGASFAALPKVEVTEGDILIDKVVYSPGTSKQGIDIKTKSTSDTASSIKLSGVKVTTDRTVPEGDFTLTIDAASNALTNQALTFNVDTISEAVIGKCVTPAPADGTAGAATGQFRIDSNIYQVNGVSKVMDAAPYIKNNRTYVPVRFLGYAMGLTDADIVWDEATQKVTFTQGSNVVELTIGSTTYTVNGESKTMDVAPEITNSRTMLPARYVAEGLGYVVGWDPATQTVLVSK